MIINPLATYTVQAFGPDAGELSPEQEDRLSEDLERFDATLRQLIQAHSGEHSALSFRISTN